jgi:hypothetical protein
VKSRLLLQSVLKEYCLSLALFIVAHSMGINLSLLLLDESKKNMPNFVILRMAFNSVCRWFSRIFCAVYILFPAFISFMQTKLVKSFYFNSFSFYGVGLYSHAI